MRHCWVVALSTFLVLSACSSDSGQSIDTPEVASEALDAVLSDLIDTARQAIEATDTQTGTLRRGLGDARRASDLRASTSCSGGGTIAVDVMLAGEGLYDGSMTITDCQLGNVTINGSLSGSITISPGRVDFQISGSLTFSGAFSGTITIHSLEGTLSAGSLCYRADITVSGVRATIGTGCGDRPDAGVPDAGSTDAGAPDADAGAPDTDAGVPDTDAGDLVDAATGCGSGQTVIIEDTEFSLENWRTEAGQVVGIVEWDAPTNPQTGGNPGAYFRIVQRGTATSTQNAQLITYHTYLPTGHDPSASPICGIDISIDTTDEFMSPATRAVSVSVILEQDGTVYRTPGYLNNDGRWVTKSDWTGADFRRLSGNGPALPNFSGGGVMHFGFLIGMSRPSTAPGPTGDWTTGVDNFRIVISLE